MKPLGDLGECDGGGFLKEERAQTHCGKEHRRNSQFPKSIHDESPYGEAAWRRLDTTQLELLLAENPGHHRIRRFSVSVRSALVDQPAIQRGDRVQFVTTGRTRLQVVSDRLPLRFVQQPFHPGHESFSAFSAIHCDTSQSGTRGRSSSSSRSRA